MRLSDLTFVACSRIHGHGLFARRAIACATFIGTYRGPRARRNGPYVLWVTDEHGVVTARSGRNALRYLNHAKPPNACFDGFDLFAARDIERGEELTIDYGWNDG